MVDALAMASGYLGSVLAERIEREENLPEAIPINALTLEGTRFFQDDIDVSCTYDPDRSFISLVMVNLAE